MVDISSLLNYPPPATNLPPGSNFDRSTTTSSPARLQPSLLSKQIMPPSTIPRVKVAKDAPVFIRGPVNGVVHFSPFECTESDPALDPTERKELKHQQQRFKIFPAGGDDGLIGDFPRHIPYSSDKKTFQGKTGRNGFDLFCYVFYVPGDDKQYQVYWDYQNGLVRITPFFKALQFQKTQPNKVLALNEGLKDLAHSITGGAIVAQGYWIPYDCARAVCLTFCWKIRWALTPVFGPTFARECIAPDQNGFNSFRIAPAIVRKSERLAMDSKIPSARYDSPMEGVASSPGQSHQPRALLSAAATPEPRNLRARRARPGVYDLDVEEACYSECSSASDDDTDLHSVSVSFGPRTTTSPESPGISPKSLGPASSKVWTTMNRSNGSLPSPLSTSSRQMNYVSAALYKYCPEENNNKGSTMTQAQHRMMTPSTPSPRQVAVTPATRKTFVIKTMHHQENYPESNARAEAINITTPRDDRVSKEDNASSKRKSDDDGLPILLPKKTKGRRNNDEEKKAWSSGVSNDMDLDTTNGIYNITISGMGLGLTADKHDSVTRDRGGGLTSSKTRVNGCAAALSWKEKSVEVEGDKRVWTMGSVKGTAREWRAAQALVEMARGQK